MLCFHPSPHCTNIILQHFPCKSSPCIVGLSKKSNLILSGYFQPSGVQHVMAKSAGLSTLGALFQTLEWHRRVGLENRHRVWRVSIPWFSHAAHKLKFLSPSAPHAELDDETTSDPNPKNVPLPDHWWRHWSALITHVSPHARARRRWVHSRICLIDPTRGHAYSHLPVTCRRILRALGRRWRTFNRAMYHQQVSF